MVEMMDIHMGGNGIAGAAHNAAQDLGNGNTDIANRQDPHHAHGEVDEGLGVGEDVKKVSSEEQKDEGDGS